MSVLRLVHNLVLERPHSVNLQHVLDSLSAWMSSEPGIQVIVGQIFFSIPNSLISIVSELRFADLELQVPI